jgi:rubredoxin
LQEDFIVGKKQNSKSYLSRLKKKIASAVPYGGVCEKHAMASDAYICPSCGASKAKEDGIVCCAYCGYEFLSIKPTDGLYIKSKDC